MSKKEMIDIVSSDDVVIDQRERGWVYERGLSGFRVVNAFIINSEGKIWVPRRSAKKELFPLHLDASIGGHVLSNESYDQAFIRETQEEVNIVIEPQSIQVMHRLTPHEHGTSSFMYVYRIASDCPPDYNKEDFISWDWLYPEEIIRKIENGDKAKGDLPIIVKHCFDVKK